MTEKFNSYIKKPIMECSQRVQHVIELAANVMEAYTTALFMLDRDEDDSLYLYGYHSLSMNVDERCTINPGEGIIGWVFREGKSVLANNFDRDTTTLKFYKQHEEIKSFLAVPLPERKGVICADSKKSYRFTEEKEKIFHQIAINALYLIEADKEKEEKELVENLLQLTWDVDKLIMTSKRENLIKNFFRIISDRLLLSHVFLVTSKGFPKSCAREKDDIVMREHGRKDFDPNGLMGWALRHGKKLVLEKKIKESDKSFILNRNENFGTVKNFVAIPVGRHEGNTHDVCGGFIKEEEMEWRKKEIDFLEGALKKISIILYP